ncbi:MAG: molybdate ABC transporter substrate-binding protein [Alphaproteobacteria bacterium]|nr:molybdate ABC transporter substrate-binding protein [Alphaproteobacteria bacterium]
MRIWAGIAGLAAVLISANAAQASERLLVYAASSLTDAMQEIADLFERRSDKTVVLTFASSAALARQVETTGLGEIFISASPLWTDYLKAQRLLISSTITPVAGNRLVVASATLKETASDETALTAMLAGPLAEGERLAIGDPNRVPAGIYARQALESLGLWEDLSARIAAADNVRAALALVTREEAVAGIVYATDLAVAPNVREIYRFPADSHDPIVYPAGLIAGGHPAGGELLDFLISEEARKIFEKHGFSVP